MIDKPFPLGAPLALWERGMGVRGRAAPSVYAEPGATAPRDGAQRRT